MMNCNLIVLLLMVGLSGCIETNLPPQVTVSAGDEHSEIDEATVEKTVEFPLTIIDANGRELTFPKTPQRVISVAPKNTELIFAMGLGDRLVGVTTFCNYPPAAEKIEKIGGFATQTISTERIVALNPDLIVCSDHMHEPLIPLWERLGFQVLVLGAESIEQMYQETELLGRVLDDSGAAEKLTLALKVRVQRVTEGVAEIPAADRPKVFYQVWDDPLMGAGPDSFIGEIMSLAGGKNILTKAADPYPYVSHEVVVARNPAIIFAPTTHSQEVNLDKIAQQPGWNGIEASQKKQIFLLDGDQVSRRGPRMIDALETMVAHMYPKSFGFYLNDVGKSSDSTEGPSE